MGKEFTKTQAAARADVSERTIDRCIKVGKLRARKVYERVIIDESDLDSFLAQRAKLPEASAGVEAVA